MKKWVGMLLTLVMVLCMMTPSFAATAQDQIVKSGETWYYDANGKLVTDDNVQFPGGAAVVELSKTVQPVSTGKENEFEVELKVRTTQNILELHSDTPDAAVMLILDVSNSMDDCDTCGEESAHLTHHATYPANGWYCPNNSGNVYYDGRDYGSSCDNCGAAQDDHDWKQAGTATNTKDHDYVARLAKAKSAAKAFLDDFAHKTGVEEGDSRWVAIVDFGSTAYRRLNWINVADKNGDGLTAAKAVIDSLTVAHSDLDGKNGRPDIDDDGGTNIEGALMLGANVWRANSTVMALDYKYTILLTDGQPTYHVDEDSDSTTVIYGDQGGGSYTTTDDAEHVGNQANRIRTLGSLSKLYSICYGSVGDDHVADHTPFSNWQNWQHNSVNPVTNDNMTILQWLKAFSTEAYDGADDGEHNLFDTFNSIISQIQLATQAWKVTDQMGEHVVWGDEVGAQNKNISSFDDETNTLHWDVLASNLDGEEKQGDYVILTYVYKYKVTLDNLDTAYTAGNPTNTNTKATLTFAVKETEGENEGLWQVKNPVAFPDPQVKGLAGSLSITKVWNDGGTHRKLEGAKFTLTSKDKSAEGHYWQATATSDDQGTVTFTGIPSGHTYTLTEITPPEGYAAVNPQTVTVNFGDTTCTGLTANNELVNVKNEKTVSLTLQKAFGPDNAYTPGEIEFTITDPDGKSQNVVLKENAWSTTLSGLKPGTYSIYEKADVPGYDLDKSATLAAGNEASNHVELTHLNNWQVNLGLDTGESHQAFTFVVTNTYTQQVGNVNVTKIFKERDHEDLLSGGSGDPVLKPMESDLYKDVSVNITLTPVKGGQTHTVTLNSENGWKGDLTGIPVGEYTIAENAENADAIQIPDHDYIHLHVMVNGQAMERNRITVGKDSNITLALENHYAHHVGDIRVAKQLNGIEADAIPTGTKFLVDVYDKNPDTAGAKVITTITVTKLDDGTWRGTSRDLLVGTYYLKEQETNIPNYDFISGVFEQNPITVAHKKTADGTLITSTTTVGLTNTYQQQKGNLTVKKVFDLSKLEKDDTFEYPEYITVNVLEGSVSGKPVKTLELNQANDWTAETELPLGTYYLSEVLGVGVAGSADVGDYGVTATWTNGGVVTIEAPENGVTKEYEATVTNTYTRDKGSVTISKEFVDVPNDSTNVAVNFVIYKLNEDNTTKRVATIVLPDSDDNDPWSKQVDLPTGTYYLYEYGARADFPNYTLTKVEFTQGNKTTIWYDINRDTDMSAITGYKFTVTENATINIAAKNTYTRDKASLSIQKNFVGLTEEQKKDLSITVGIYNGETLVQNVTLNQGNNWSATVTGLDAGVQYTLKESGADVEGYNLSARWSNNSIVTLEKGKDVTNILTNTYTQKMGTLTLHKIFSGMLPEEVELLEGKEIEVTVQSADENVSFEPRNIKLKGTSWSNAITLPVGTYTLTETAITLPGYDHEDAVFTGTGVTESATDKFTATVVVTENTTVDVRLTNHMERHTGSLTIAKEFTDDSALKEDYFVDKTINVLVKRNGQVYRTVTLPVTNADGSKTWSVILDDVPTGNYTVEEVTTPGDPGSAHVNNHGLTVTYSDGTIDVTVSEDTNVTKTITNKYTEHVGNIIVNKEFADETSKIAEDNIPNSGIAIHLYNEDGGIVDTGYVSRENGGSHIFVELPLGTYYLVEETGEGKPGTAWVDGYELAAPQWVGGVENVPGKGYEVEVTENTTASLTVTNTYTRNGNLSVEKKFGACDTCGAVRPATVTVELYRGPAEGATAAERVGEPVVLNAGNKWNYTWPGLEAGTYSVREVEGSANIANHTLSVTYDHENVTVAQDTTTTVIITNTYTHVKGSLTIEKVFAQNSELNETYFADKQISFQVKGPGNLAQQVTLPVEDDATGEKAWSVTLTDLPVGDYTVEEAGAQVPGYGLIVTYSDAQNQGKVQVVAAAEGTVPAKMTVTNTYTKTTGELKITKAFADGSALDADDIGSINVDILSKTSNWNKQVILSKENNWTWVESLPLGEYIVREVTTPGEAGSAYRAGYSLNVEYSDEAKNGSVTVGAAPAEITITNHYTYVPVYGSLMIKKEFKGEPSLYPASVEFTITGPGYSQTVIVSATNNWTAYIGGLSGGEYTVTEAQVSGADYDLTTTWSSQGGKIHVYPGQTATITCTNAYYYKDTVSFRIPVEKTVHLIGSKAPVGVVQFSFGAAWQGSNGVTVRFENDPANTLGAFQQISANTYAATLNGPGTVKGYIVIEGYADQLADFKLQTWENLTGYTDEEAAAAAGWTFDKTATDGAINWNVEVGYTGQNGLGASIARTDTGLAGKVSFDNVYTSPVEVPETGDGENLALWIALCTVSALGVAVLLVSHKRKAFMANR